VRCLGLGLWAHFPKTPKASVGMGLRRRRRAVSSLGSDLAGPVGCSGYAGGHRCRIAAGLTAHDFSVIDLLGLASSLMNCSDRSRWEPHQEGAGNLLGFIEL
jgi:hypothetical protein